MPVEYGYLLIACAACGAFFMAFNNGANDVANAFASAVGSKALTIQRAILIASLVVFAGAVLLGGRVATKLIEGVVNPHLFPDPTHYVAAMLSVLLAAGVFVLFSTLTGMPVSSSHAIVGSLLGVCVAVAGWGSVRWGIVAVIVFSWLISPVLAGGMSLVLCTGIKHLVIGTHDAGAHERVRRWLPIIVAVVICAAFYAIVTETGFKEYIGLGKLKLIHEETLTSEVRDELEAAERDARQAARAARLGEEALTTSVAYAAYSAERAAIEAGEAKQQAAEAFATLARIREESGEGMVSLRSGNALIDIERWQVAVIALLMFYPVYRQFRFLIRKWLEHAPDSMAGAEEAFRRLQVGTSCYVAFGIGANDVANSISPVLAVAIVVQNAGIPEHFTASMPFWILGLGGVGMATGITLLGYRVMRTLGDRLTRISNSRGFAIDFSVATTIVTASAMGLPVSTTHAATGAVVGSGLSTGARNVNFTLLARIIVTWLITVPVAALVSVGLYKLVELIFL
jgi:phosphate/sulfate permease